MSYQRTVVAAAVLALSACSGPRVDIDAEIAAIRARGEALVAAGEKSVESALPRLRKAFAQG